MTSIYCDVSAYQGQINWPEYVSWAKGQGYTPMAAIKATEGVNFTDAWYERNRQGALSAGVEKLLFYSYARPDKGNSAQAEANYLHSVVGSVRPQDALMLDIEVVPPANWAYEWTSQQDSNGQTSVVYSYDAFIRAHLQDSRLTKYGLIMANYTYDANARPACPLPWKQYIALQYTDKATIPGIAGPVDANIWFGSEGDDMAITINSPNVANYFEELDATHWKCKSNGNEVHDGMLSFYKSDNGLLNAGLPKSNEIGIATFGSLYAALANSGITVQFYERQVYCYDPDHKIDNPPGSGAVYPMHLYNGGPGTDPLVNQLKNEIANLQKQLQSSDPTDAAKLAQIKALIQQASTILG